MEHSSFYRFVLVFLLENILLILSESTLISVPIPGHENDEPSDEGLYNENLFEGDIVLKTSFRKNAVPLEAQLWPQGVIPYTTKFLGCPSSPQCELLMSAMDHYHQNTCIRFKEWTGEKNRVEIFFDAKEAQCSSKVGRTGDMVQLISLGYKCWYRGIILHELGHVIGFNHEMTRPDRDKFIKIIWENIRDGSLEQFMKKEQVKTLETFDYNSIMLYDEFAFTKEKGFPTVEVLKPNTIIGPIWNKTSLSVLDKKKINKLYSCNGKKPKPGFPEDIICSFNTDTCGFKNAGKVLWKHFKTRGGKKGYIYTTFEDSGSVPTSFISTNYYQDSRKPKGHKGCVRFWYQIRGNGPAKLELSFAPLKKVTDLFYESNATEELWSSFIQSNTWQFVEIGIPVSNPFKVIFESEFDGRSRTGIIFIDQFHMSYKNCSSVGDKKSPPPQVDEKQVG